MTIFLNSELRPARPGLKLVQAVAVEVATITGLAATDVRAAIIELLAAIPANAAALTSTASGNLSAVTVQTALEELQADIDSMDTNGTLSASERRALGEIVEAATDTFTDVSSATLARSDGLSPPAPFGSFIFPYTGVAASERFFFDVPTGTDLANLVIREFDSGGAVTVEVPVADAESQSGAAVGFQRYLTTQTLTVTTTDTLRLQTKATTFDTYTLSGKYRVPAAGITGTIAETQLDTAFRSNLNALEQSVFTRVHTQFINQVVVNETIPTAAIASLRLNTKQETSHEIADYTTNPGNAVPVIAETFVTVLINENEAIRSVVDTAVPATNYTFTDLGLIVTGFRGYRITFPAGASGTATVNGGVPTLNSVTFGNTVKVNLGNLSTALQAQLIKPGHGAFFQHVQIQGGVISNSATVADFYYLVATSLPERDLTKWTHVTNSVFPQVALSEPADYVFLLVDGKYPNEVTWDADPTQPQPGSAGQPNIGTLERGAVREVDGSTIPEGFEGFRFRMPPWNTASAARTGARLSAGDILDSNVDRIDFDPKIKVTDENLEIKHPNTALTSAQQAKLDGLSLKRYTQGFFTTGKTNSDYELVMATAWPDENIDYGAATAVVLGSRPSRTGAREGSSGAATFFNIISSQAVTLGAATPGVSGVNYMGNFLVANDGAAGPGIIGGTITLTDGNGAGSERLLTDDLRGVMAVQTLHVSHALPAGSYEVLNIGDVPGNMSNALVLKKSADGELELLARIFTGSPTQTNRRQRVSQFLRTTGQTSNGFFTNTVSGPLDTSQDWVIPDSYSTGLQNEVQFSLRIRVWNNDNDEGEADFTASLPAAIQGISNFDNAVPETTFVLPIFETLGHGQGDITWSIQYDPPSAGGSPPNTRIIRINADNLNNAALTYEFTLFANTYEVVTVPAGSTRDVEIVGGAINGTFDRYGVYTFDTSDRDYEIGLYAYSRAGHGASATRRLFYQASVNGRVSAEFDTGEVAPTGKVPITFGNANTHLGFNRFVVARPRQGGLLSSEAQGDLTSPQLRNRVNVGGLVRLGGGTYTEVFSPAYQILEYQNENTQAFSTVNGAFLQIGFEQVSGLDRDLEVGVGGLFFTANTNFIGQLTFTAGIQVDVSQLSSQLAQRAFLDVRAMVQHQVGGTGEWVDVPGPYMQDTVERSVISADRVGASSSIDPVLIRHFSRHVNFVSGNNYRMIILVGRLRAGTTTEWPQSSDWLTLPKNRTHLSLIVLPTI